MNQANPTITINLEAFIQECDHCVACFIMSGKDIGEKDEDISAQVRIINAFLAGLQLSLFSGAEAEEGENEPDCSGSM